MRLTLCIPGLLLPQQALADTARDLPLPALATLLGHGRVARLASADPYAWLAQACGWPSLPAAALRLLGEGGEPADDAWLCLDPVHLKVHRRGIALDDPAALELDAADDAALRGAVAPLFAAFGVLHGQVPGHWYLRLHRTTMIDTPPLPQAVARDLDPRLPAGPDGARWRAVLADAQPVLHAHPANGRRAAAGRPAADSLWPWGGGVLPAVIEPSPWASVASGDPVILGLARRLGALVAPVPQGFAGDPAPDLIVLDALAAPARSLDAIAWSEALARLEAEWFAPLAAALRAGRLTGLRLAGFGGDGGIELDVTRHDLWKFWRRPRGLAEASA